jgi:transmembrane sensor
MDYSKFGIEDFLSDVSFQQYCLGNNDEAVAFWTDWIAAHPEKARSVKSAKILYYTLNGNITDDNFRQDYELFQKAFGMSQSVNVKPLLFDQDIAPVKSNNKQLYTLLGLAASLLIICTLYFINLPGKPKADIVADAVYFNAAGKKISIKLADGTLVVLNGASTLKVSKNYNHQNREVTLEGEGYFTVVHDNKKPFIVHTAQINVRDIGTEFNVKAYHNDKTTEASLIHGAIEITGNNKLLAGKKPIVLTPNKKFVMLNNIAVKPGDKNIAIAKEPYKIKSLTTNVGSSASIVETDWTQNRLSFYDERLEDIAIRMERWYGVKVLITNDAAKQYRFTASFDNETILQVLQALQLSGNFNYRKEKDVISIY